MVKKKVNTKKITRESLIKSVAKATMVNSEIVREFFDELEDLIFEHLISRAMQRDGVTREKVLERMARQQEYPNPDIIINNV